MYEAVHAHPDGETTVARFAHTAAEYGYDGIVVRNHGDARADYDAERIAEAYDIDVVPGLEIRADDQNQASGYIGNYRRQYTLLLMHGGSKPLNRFAVEQDRIDVLCHPMRDRGDFNHVLAKAAAENGVRIEFNLRDVLRKTGGQRVQSFQSLRKLRELVEKYDAPYVVSGDPRSHLELRASRELVALGEAIGFDREQVADGLREWGRLATRNRERESDAFIEPGVRRGRYEETD
ncbi:RNase P subunit p30 family protein [Haloarchaeobius sp. HME9146]|uniref:RNase P subunit p30 family protein n=1 Tax=Haloarchaeobius sp. HME9146 TaxID=2978732 RepID=UPI0021BF0C73|nr:RNase P subunit p30 family protein [Haloarchaeobius sp. HME9146]MCT9096909.1 RNase P subunit p30 family protein [Haloarchaeobius sp. HME9146]